MYLYMKSCLVIVTVQIFQTYLLLQQLLLIIFHNGVSILVAYVICT